MNFTQAVAEVVAEIKRPDKINSARREVNAAITFYCLDNHFSRDLAERSLPITPNEYIQAFDLSEFERFRHFKYIKRGGTTQHLTPLAGSDILKACTQQDKYYIAGETVNINMARLAATLDIGWYKYPPVLTGAAAANEFWLLAVSPWMVINRAIGMVFKAIGDEKSYQTHLGIARDDYLAARKDLGIATQ